MVRLLALTLGTRPSFLTWLSTTPGLAPTGRTECACWIGRPTPRESRTPARNPLHRRRRTRAPRAGTELGARPAAGTRLLYARHDGARALHRPATGSRPARW